MIEGFSAYSGSDFLLFYALLVVAAIVAGVWVPTLLRADGAERSVQDRYEAAFLAGGGKRVAETALAQLLAEDALAPSGERKVRVIRETAAKHPLEKTLLRKPLPFGLTETYKAIEPHIADIKQRLVRQGLLLADSQRMPLRIVSVLPYLVVLGIGWYRRAAGVAEGEPVGYLTALMVVAAIFALIRFVKLDPRTRGGITAVADARNISKRLKTAPTTPEVGYGVALFGTAILAGTPYAELHAMREAARGDGSGGYAADGSDSSDGSGSSDSGCGGGCGGCGG